MGSTLAAIIAFLVIGYIVGSVKIINEGYQAIVERLGQYSRTLGSGIHFIIPIVDQIVWVQTTREQIIDFPPQDAITNDNINLKIDAIVYWRILEIRHSYYNIDNLEDGLTALVITSLRSLIGQMKLEDTYSSRTEINRILLQQLDEATATWGVKVIRVEVQNIILPQRVQESLEQERAAESEKRAFITTAEGKRQAAIEEARGTVESAQMIAGVLGDNMSSQDVLSYLIARQYVDANLRLGESDNSKILFMDPRSLTEGMTELLKGEFHGQNNRSRPRNGQSSPPQDSE